MLSLNDNYLYILNIELVSLNYIYDCGELGRQLYISSSCVAAASADDDVIMHVSAGRASPRSLN